MPVYPSPRVSQLDAYILDNELFSLLKQQLSDVFALQSNKPWSYSQNPELWLLALNVLVFRLTTWKSGSSYGLKLQNLKFTNSRSGKLIGSGARIVLLGVLVGDYLFKRLQLYLYSADDVRSSGELLVGKLKNLLIRHKSTLLNRANSIIKLANLANFLLFLVQGRFPTLVHRILGISLTPVVADLLKFNGDNVNFEFQNRQLVWNVMTEFLVFTLPLLHIRKWTRALRSLFPSRNGSNSAPLTSETPLKTRFSDLPVSQCAICIELTEISGIKAASTYVTNPCITNCGHIFCYVCLATRFNAIENGSEEAEGCPRCRMKLESFRLCDNDVDQDAIMVDYEEAEEEQPEEKSEKLPQDVNSDNSANSDSSDSSDSADSASDYDSDELAYEEGVDELDELM